MTRNAQCLCLSVAMLLGLAWSAAAGSYRHEPTGLLFPERLAQLEKGEVTDFEPQIPGGGIGVGYSGPGITVTLYVYALGRKSIPDGFQSRVLKEHFKETVGDVMEAGRRGLYKGGKKESEGVAAWDAGETGRKSLHAQFRFTQGGRERHSHLYLTGFRDHFIKIRFTYDAQVQGAAEKTLKDFLAEMSRLLDAPAGSKL